MPRHRLWLDAAITPHSLIGRKSSQEDFDVEKYQDEMEVTWLFLGMRQRMLRVDPSI